mgnify:FL=1
MSGTPPIKTIRKSNQPVVKRTLSNIDKLRKSHFIFCKNYLVILSNFKTNNIKQRNYIEKVKKYFEFFINQCNTNKNITNNAFEKINLTINTIKKHVCKKIF